MERGKKLCCSRWERVVARTHNDGGDPLRSVDPVCLSALVLEQTRLLHNQLLAVLVPVPDLRKRHIQIYRAVEALVERVPQRLLLSRYIRGG